MTNTSTQAWRQFGASVRGSQHERSGLPNQDSWGAQPLSGDGEGLVIAVADGHGSPKACRSAEGSRLAVQAACQILNEFVAEHRSAEIPVVKAEAERRLASRLVLQWRALVTRDHATNPINDEELSRVQTAAGESARRTLTEVDGFYHAYGSTVLAAVVTPRFVLYFQLGDGDILVVPRPGEETLRPIPPDEHLIANETTSLCLEPEKAIGACQVRFHFIQGEFPSLILLSSDGYSNSFTTATGFERVATDLLAALQSEGQEWVERQLPDWLAAASSAGSGDDVTLAVLWRGPAAATPRS